MELLGMTGEMELLGMTEKPRSKKVLNPEG
jgi:hypothetical protein